MRRAARVAGNRYDPAAALPAITIDAAFTLVTSIAAGVETSAAPTGARTICDAAGNCATAGPVGGNHIDRRPPDIAVTLPASGSFLVGASATATVTCAGGGAGMATCVTTQGIDTSSVGTRDVIVTASDLAGNASSAHASYTVRLGVRALFDQSRAAKAGATVPIAMQLLDASGPMSVAVPVVATGLRAPGSSAILPVQSPGNSQPGVRPRSTPAFISST